MGCATPGGYCGITRFKLLICRCRFRLLRLFMFIRQLDTCVVVFACVIRLIYDVPCGSYESVCHRRTPRRKCASGECTQTLSRNSTPNKLTQFLRIVLPQYPPGGTTHEGRAAISSNKKEISLSASQLNAYKHRKRIGLLHICYSAASCRRYEIFVVTLLKKTVTCSIIGFSVRKLERDIVR